MKSSTSLKIAYIETPLGFMKAIADEKVLHALHFLDKDAAENKGLGDTSAPLLSIEKELEAYFQGRLKNFNTPLHLEGTPFQISVWKALLEIPFGETRSYLEQAKMLNKEKAYRAVANANGANPLSLIIPCHRIIQNNGQLGGYRGGLDRKKWLLDHERALSLCSG